jgi:hypothetical protein
MIIMGPVAEDAMNHASWDRFFGYRRAIDGPVGVLIVGVAALGSVPFPRIILLLDRFG